MPEEHNPEFRPLHPRTSISREAAGACAALLSEETLGPADAASALTSVENYLAFHFEKSIVLRSACAEEVPAAVQSSAMLGYAECLAARVAERTVEAPQ